MPLHLDKESVGSRLLELNKHVVVSFLSAASFPCDVSNTLGEVFVIVEPHQDHVAPAVFIFRSSRIHSFANLSNREVMSARLKLSGDKNVAAFLLRNLNAVEGGVVLVQVDA